MRNEGYQPIRVAIPWKGSTISENTDYFLRVYKKSIAKASSGVQVYLLGFSYGAMIAFLAATKISVKGLILCSLSPFFKEDLPKKHPKNISSLQVKRFNDFSTLKSTTLAKKIRAKCVYMFYGVNESKPLIARVTKTFQQIPKHEKYLLSVKNMQHNIADTKYMTAIHYSLKTFL